jgi:hypothetical protein
MTEFYSKTYNYLEIDVVKRADCVTISCLDKQLHKSYRETFTCEIIANMFNMGSLKNFIVILEQAFDEKSILIVSEHEKLNFEIIVCPY